MQLSLNFTPVFLLLKVAGEQMHNDTDFSDLKFKTVNLMKVHHAAAIPSHFPSAFTLHLQGNYFMPSLSSNLQQYFSCAHSQLEICFLERQWKE